MQTYADYLNFVSSIPPHLLHFGDEKLLKGMEVFNRKGQVNPFAGKSDLVVDPPYFQNTYCIMGFITTNTNKSPPFLYTIGDDNYDSAAYMSFIVSAVTCGWLSKGDFVVVDNVILYLGGHADVGADFLWNVEELD